MQRLHKSMDPKLVQKISVFLFALIIFFGIFFRIANLDKKALWHDEIYTELRVSGYPDIAVKNARWGKIISKKELMKFQGSSKENGFGDILKSLRTDIHPPLYFVSLKYWQDIWGNSLVAMRSFSAVFGILSLYLMYILCQEIFDSILTARIAVSLMALSPIFIRYSLEVRPYPMWVFSLLLSTYLLHKGLKSKDKKIWVAYAITLGASFHLHLLSFFFYIGHFVYVVITKIFSDYRKIFIYLFSSIVGFLTFMPWFLQVIIPKQKSIKIQSAWIRSKIPFESLLNEQLNNISHLFISHQFSDNPYLYISGVIFLSLIVFSFIYLIKTQRVSSWLLVCTLGYSTLLFLYQDMVSGGQRTRIPHYALPCFLAILIALSHIISSNIISSSKFKSNLWGGIFGVLIILGFTTNMNTISDKHWWGWSRFDSEIAEIINPQSNPLIICNSRIGALMPLTNLLNEDAKFLMLNPDDPPILEIFDDYNNIYLVSPSGKIKNSFIDQYKSIVEELYIFNDGFVKAELFKVSKDQ